ncbi:Response regulator receiver protein [Acidisarcina polymorpha]|uniref:Response regulator receiver protein n=1 Tax=Acidisarcina polymorpha TaxID=2211140 RepID=A0A2Z5FT57_9BACT|nr:response regulator [Acidisarcina polymorpha]AXC09892.1 Response regulator receiver protein [Acidisarcina polymorpha]
MTARHRVLVVEDDVEFSLDLQQILKSLKCESVPVTNAEDAIRELKAKPFCLVLLDLQIKSEPNSNKAHLEHGKSLLRDIRQMYSEHNGVRFWLPVLVVSGYARERDIVLEVMRDNASNIIEKPDTKTISEAIRKAFAESGRDAHDQCENHRSGLRDNFSEKVVVTIPGDRDKQRIIVRLGSQPVKLTVSSLRILLHLILGYLQNRQVHKNELGANNEQGFKGISILRNELKQVLGEIDIVKNHYHGIYALITSVEIGEITFDKLFELGDHQISSLVVKLQQVSAPPAEKV